MPTKKKGSIVLLVFGVLFTLSVAVLLYFTPLFVSEWIERINSNLYDLKVRKWHKPLPKEQSIAIVDIDDKSLSQEGRWPWPRKKLAQMTNKLYKLGAQVVAYDLIFSEKEENIIDEIIDDVQGEADPAFIQNLKKRRAQFNYDKLFAQSLTGKEAVLSLVFHPSIKKEGVLPAPLLPMTKELEKLILKDMKGYLGNIAILQKAAKHAGGINATPDFDGVIRFSPLVFKYKKGIYPALGLQAAMVYLLTDKIKLKTSRYGKETVLEGVQLDQFTIPTDPKGRVLVPFRGPSYTFSYVSATDVLQENVDPNKLQNKLIFIGSSATGMGDLTSTSIAPVYPGVEIHASIAQSIMDHYFPYKPAWGKGVSIILIVSVGMLAALLFPFLGPVVLSIVALLLLASFLALDYWAWTKYQIVLSFLFPLITIFTLYLVNLVFGYLFEARRRKEMKSIFGQYVPSKYLDTMLKKGGDFDLEGENKELTVLFSDIRGFTSLSEKFSAKEIKELLNFYLTPMTKVIFDRKGTIDKYVGDMIMAFWGAPLKDDEHAKHAVIAGLAMHQKLNELNETLRKEKDTEMHIGVGINTGMMNVGDMGSEFRRAYTVLGDSVNLGSRLEGLCKYYFTNTIVGQETFEKTKEAFLYKELDKVQVKGKKEPITIYQPLCLQEEASKEMKEEAEKHHKALAAYRERKWDEAEKIWQELVSLPDKEKHYTLYLEKVKEAKEAKLPDDWQGVHVLESK